MKKISTGIALALSGLLYSAQATANLVITEAMSKGSGTSDWFELTNTGTSTVSLTGFKMDDNSFAFVSAVPLLGIDSIAPGESVIFVESPSATFSTVWGSAFPNLRVGTYTGNEVDA